MIGEALRTWLLGIVAAGMLMTVLYALLPKGRMQPIAHAVGGVALLLVVVQPLMRVDMGEFAGSYEAYRQEIEELTEAYRQAGESELAGIIADKTAAYIASKGEEMGVACTVRVTTETREGVPYPTAVTLDIPREESLSAWIGETLGIDAAHQFWREDEG